jgi:cell division protein ZapA (FtsZ GTPase activity inhibitor)
MSGAVRVTIGGHELLVSSPHPPDYTREVAAYFDAALARMRAELPTIDAHRAAILAGLAVTDELFQARQADAASARRIQAVTEELARLVPPAKRGPRSRESAGPGH